MSCLIDLQKQINLALQGDPEQEYCLGLRYYLGDEVVQDFKSSVDLFTRSGDHGNTRAQFQLGFMYYEGHGVKKNYKLAYHWFLKAAEKGDIWGQFYCAFMNRQPQISG